MRFSRTVGALTTRFASDVNGTLSVVLTESGPTGTRTYVYGADGLAYVDEGLVTGIRVMHTDGLGSVRALREGVREGFAWALSPPGESPRSARSGTEREDW